MADIITRAAEVRGLSLFEAVLNAEIRGRLRTSINEARQQGAGLRFRIHFTDVPELAELPWEYLYDATLDEFPALSVQTPLVRYLDLPIKTTPLEVTLPIKVLVMISSPNDYPKLDVEKEYQNLIRALGDMQQRGLVQLTRLEKATLADLQRQLRKDDYHIFHFIGHGGFDSQSEDGVLLLEDEMERGRPVSGRYLGTLLHDQKSLRLAILNACEGARTARSDPFSGVAHSLDQKGIPAVIAMQRFAAVAFVSDTVMLIIGSVWAQDAWGRYWAWDPLETWAFLTWLALAFGLHLKVWMHPPPLVWAVLVSVVFVLAFLTFFGVPFVSESPHKGVF